MGHTCAVLLYRVIAVTPPWLIAAGARATPLTTAREKDSILSAWKNKKNKTEPESFSFSNTNKRKQLHRHRELLFNLLWHWRNQNQELMWRCLYPYFTQWVDIMRRVVAQGVEVLQSAYRSNSEQDTEAWVSPNKEIEVWVCPKRRTRHLNFQSTTSPCWAE